MIVRIAAVMGYKPYKRAAGTVCVCAANVTRLTALAVSEEELQDSELELQNQLLLPQAEKQQERGFALARVVALILPTILVILTVSFRSFSQGIFDSIL